MRSTRCSTRRSVSPSSRSRSSASSSASASFIPARLVQEEEARLSSQGAGDLDAALVAVGERLGAGLGEVADSKSFEQLDGGLGEPLGPRDWRRVGGRVLDRFAADGDAVQPGGSRSTGGSPKRRMFWKVRAIPRAAMRSGESALMRSPLSRTCPLDGSVRPLMMSMRLSCPRRSGRSVRRLTAWRI